MKPMPLTHFLPVLDAHKSRQIEAPRRDIHLVPAKPVRDEESLPDRRNSEAAAYELGFREGCESFEAREKERLAEEERRFAERLELARAAWTRDQGSLIANGVVKALGVIERGICEGAERILKQVIDETMRQRAMAEFAESIGHLLRDGEAGIITVHGPADLLTELQTRLLPHGGTVEFNEQEGAEVWVRVDQTHIETRFGAWRSSLKIEG
ncbi:MAG: hypothetical protein JWM36_3786 [Hyphomicrobiales bacterium]|jgi:hypothetical protein|nr:hypothetical protein [Hyphomicrobiales bacterium]